MNCMVAESNLKGSNAFSIISDGGTGYYATGYIESSSKRMTGMQFMHYSSTSTSTSLSPSWEIAPFSWGSDFDD
jgi:hypothetical protein